MKRIIAVILTLLLTVCIFTGCAAKESMDYVTEEFAPMAESAPMEEPMPEAEMEFKNESAAEGGFDMLDNTEAHTGERKIIYTADYSISSEQFDADYNKILAAMETAGGYLSSENTNGTRPEEYGDPGRSANFTLRIPIENYASFLDALSGIGTVQSKSQFTEDVTTAYYDNEARIELYEAHYKKLMEYLDKAASIEDAMSIESQITETLYTIDSLKGTRSYYDSMTQYTTVNIYLWEVVYSSDVPVSKQTLGERISNSFSDVISALGVFFEGVLVVIVAGAPIWIILVIIALAIILPIRAHRKKKQRKAEAALKAQEEKKEEAAE